MPPFWPVLGNGPTFRNNVQTSEPNWVRRKPLGEVTIDGEHCHRMQHAACCMQQPAGTSSRLALPGTTPPLRWLP